jgi:hypothetical protein
MEKFKDKISSDRIRQVERSLTNASVAGRFGAVAASDGELRAMIERFLSSDQATRQRHFHDLLGIMRKNAVRIGVSPRNRIPLKNLLIR